MSSGVDRRELYRKKYPNATPYELATDSTTEATAMSPMRLPEPSAAWGKAPTFLYLFAWEMPVIYLRVAHTLDIPFVFNSKFGELWRIVRRRPGRLA
jgi:hypothetical protein